MKIFLLVLMFIFGVELRATAPQVLLLLAHYDDETMISRTLIQLKERGFDIRAIYLTKGEGGKDTRLKESLSEVELKEHLIRVRNDEMKASAKVYGIKKFYQVGVPDIPLRIPEEGYPNPKGRPSTDVKKFLDSNIWNFNEIERKVKNILIEKNINPTYVLTLSDDSGLIHAHHQVTNMLARKIDFGENIKGVYGFLEPQWYEPVRFKYRERALYVGSNDNDLIAQVHKGYQAHKSQLVSTVSIDTIKQMPEIIYSLQGNLENLETELKGSRIRSFQNQLEWNFFHSNKGSLRSFTCLTYLKPYLRSW